MDLFENFVNDIVFTDKKQIHTGIRRAEKQFSKIFSELGHKPINVLNLGFTNYLTLWLESIGINVDYNTVNHEKYDTVLAMDEYFTYSNDEAEQRELIDNTIDFVAKGGLLLTTIADYRNNPNHKKNLGDTSFVNISKDNYVIVEINTPDQTMPQSWEQTNFLIKNASSAIAFDQGRRRTLYFKQLAKYSNDKNCKQFGVLRDQYWKSPWKKSTEHIAWSRF
jgi:hypothetical protein